MDSYKHLIGGYLAQSMGHSLAEHGAHRLLIDAYFAQEQPFGEREALTICNARTAADRRAVRRVLANNFVFREGLYFSPQIEAEIAQFHETRERLAGMRARDVLRDRVYKRDGYACIYCGACDLPLELDHIMPRSRGGSDDPGNLATACRPCNRDKRDRTPDEWKAARAKQDT